MAFFLASASSFSLFSLSFSSVRLFFSFSLIALSNSLSSSVLFGALTPSAPAINLPATAVVFSGLFSIPLLLSPRPLTAPPYGVLSGKSNGVGDAGVGGGGCGDSSFSSLDVTVEMGSRESCGEDFDAALGSSVSVSEPSRSQLSATGLDFGLAAGFCGLVVESLRCVRVEAISGAIVSTYAIGRCI
jgi:hypothetical protein